jgi:hypothetical protein
MIMCNTYHFGNHHRFGITFELPQDTQMYHGTWLNGAAWYWVFGHCIGDMQYSVPLCDVLIVLEPIQKRTSFQCTKTIFNAGAEQILQTMDLDIDHEADGISQENDFGFVGTSDFWNSFVVSLDLDIMEEQILYFEHDTQARLIIAKLDERKEYWVFQSEYMLNTGEVQAVIQEAFNWLQLRYQQELTHEQHSNGRS